MRNTLSEIDEILAEVKAHYGNADISDKALWHIWRFWEIVYKCAQRDAGIELSLTKEPYQPSHAWVSDEDELVLEWNYKNRNLVVYLGESIATSFVVSLDSRHTSCDYSHNMTPAQFCSILIHFVSRT